MTKIQETYIQFLEDFYASNVLTLRGKMEDYSEDNDPFSNFRFAAQAAGVTVEQVFLVLMGVKLARLKELLTTGKVPNNESVTDTLGDDANYDAICASYLHFKNSEDPDYAYSASPESDDEPLWDDAGTAEPFNVVEMTPLERFKALFVPPPPSAS